MSDRQTMNGKPVYTRASKTVINWESGFKQKLLCDGSTFSTGSACCYSCSFCYVPAIMQRSPQMDGIKEAFHDVVVRRANALGTLEEQLRSAKGKRLANQKLVIYASPLVDVAGNMDLVRETIEACESILSLTNWDIRLLSKSNLLPKVALGLEGHCASAEARKRVIYGVSTGTLDDKLAKAFEAGTSLVSKRIESLHWLQDNGYRTFGMICPSLPMRDAYDYQIFANSAYSAIRAHMCEHVWAEVINVRGDSFTRTRDALVAGGFKAEAKEIDIVSSDKMVWEQYSRQTFMAHHSIFRDHDALDKLRFLQYVNKDNEQWWSAFVGEGAVLLGH